MGDWIGEIEKAGVLVLRDVPGRELTTFGSGGRVKYLLTPLTVTGACEALKSLSAEGIPCRVIGGGSNLLLPDKGFHGALISLSQLSSIAVADNVLSADAGVKLPLLAGKAAQESLSGLEFACGIPGTVGGSVRCNAGAFGQSLSDVLTAVIVLTERGEVEVVSAEEMAFSYHSCRLPDNAIILSALFSLKKGKREEIEALMREMTIRRRSTQPCERSAGSVFRRVNGTSAAVYIEQVGLKGYRVGGAELSRVHCNFIVNKGGATTADYFAVAECVRERVQKQSGVTLEYEVERICSPIKR